MNSRERVKAAINYQKPDRIPCNESPWPDTVEKWYEQGLPKDVSLADYFGFDICSMYLDTSPRFEQKIVERENEYYIFEDRYGYTAKKFFGKAGTIDFISHVTKGQQSWENQKHRWKLSSDIEESARIDDASYFEHFDPYPS